MSQLPSIRFGSSWSTQLRLTQAIGRALSELKPENLAYSLAKAIDTEKRQIEVESIQVSYGEHETLPLTQPAYWSSLTSHIDRQWDQRILCAPLHPGAERYYREIGVV
jgi:TRAP-type uncharacterized transport system substrate-binding protein